MNSKALIEDDQSNFSNFREDPLVDKLRTQLGVIHPIPSYPVTLSYCRYQIGLRYTGGARMLLMLSLKFGILPIVVPVGVRDFDIDGELWVKLRLIPTQPWVGAVSCPFVSLPKVTFQLAAFRLFNLMGIPVLSMFLTKLLTEDLPRLFVRPKKIVLDFQKGKAVGPVSEDLKSGEMQEGNKDFVGELSVTLVDAQRLRYMFSGKTDPYAILRLGDQVIRSKRNSQTTVTGAPGQPIWNQDFQFLVSNPREQVLQIEVNDCVGFADMAIGTGEVDLRLLQDTVPRDRIVILCGGWSLFGKGSAGEVLLRLTYKAYVEEEEDDRTNVKAIDVDASDDEMYGLEELGSFVRNEKVSSDDIGQESLMNVLSALIVSEEFQGIVSSDVGDNKLTGGDSLGAPKAWLDSRSQPAITSNGSDSNADISDSGLLAANSGRGTGDNGGSSLLWFGIITGILVLVAINMEGSSFFNP